MTTTTSIQEIEEHTTSTKITPERSGLTHSRRNRIPGFLRRFWRDQVFLQERLAAVQHPWDDANGLGWRPR